MPDILSDGAVVRAGSDVHSVTGGNTDRVIVEEGAVRAHGPRARRQPHLTQRGATVAPRFGGTLTGQSV
ncbi:hypothetical protein [Streptomyces sp. NPDC088812]|uniref:hypothetical protein n=1 Tax=Streptomyces sp. NPDC088812 TaxID=3365905 RepID=UPI00380C53D2